MSLGTLLYRIMPSVNKGSLMFSLLVYILFYFFCLIAVSKTSSTMLNNFGEMKTQVSSTNDLSFSLSNIMLAVALSEAASIMLR